MSAEQQSAQAILFCRCCQLLLLYVDSLYYLQVYLPTTTPNSELNQFLALLQTLHSTGWTQTRKFVGDQLPVFNLTPRKKSGLQRDVDMMPLDPQLQPWMASGFSSLQGGEEPWERNFRCFGRTWCARDSFQRQKYLPGHQQHPATRVPLSG